MSRGVLRVYLGAAPGVGKTYAMLEEGRRRRSRGTDVVIGYVETHGRANTEAAIGDLEIIPRRTVTHRGVTLEEMDLDAILARRPAVALVDELAHTNAPGGRHDKRWQDVEELLEAGIDVISTVNVQHLESLNDVIADITGAPQQETVPDAFVRAAEQIHFVDQTPEALRRRMAHGNIYRADRVDAALANFFRVGNLAALRELALLWMADRVDDELQRYRESHGIGAPWETRERILVALTGAPTGDALIRRAARIAERTRGELIGVHISSSAGVGGPEGSSEGIERQRELLAALGGHYREAAGGDVAGALLAVARAAGATQIVLGATRRGRVHQLVQGSIIHDVIARAGPIDVLVVSRTDDEEPDVPTPDSGDRTRRSTGIVRRDHAAFSRRRLGTAWLLAIILPPLLTVLIDRFGEDLELSTRLLGFTLLVALIALCGGFPPALFGALASFALANWFFTPPVHTWTVKEPEHLLALVVFVAVASAIGFSVSAASRRQLDARRARSDAQTLAAMAAAMASRDPLGTLVAQLRTATGATGVAVLRRDGPGWEPIASTGAAPVTPDAATTTAALGPDTVVVIGGDAVQPLDAAVFESFTAHLADALERDRLDEEVRRADRLAEVDRLRTSLLGSVSHDLRTPLTAIKAASSTLAQPGASWPSEVVTELCASIDEETDRLIALVENLLTMTRISAGEVRLDLSPIDVGDAISGATALIDLRGHELIVDLDEPLEVFADQILLERSLANLIDNACKWSPPDTPIVVDAATVAEEVIIRVSDRGPGIPPDQRSAAFAPFQRLGDAQAVEGTGLGLAIAQGFVTAMGGSIEIEDTPGGGATMVVHLLRRVAA